MSNFIDVLILPFRYIVTYLFNFEIIEDLSLGAVLLVAGVFGAIISVISRSSVTLGSPGKSFRKSHGITQKQYYDKMADDYMKERGN